MSKSRPVRSNDAVSNSFEQARDELFSHILRCGVLEAIPADQKEWFDDTMDYLTERYEYLNDAELSQLRELGERYCQPVIQRNEAIGASS